MKKVTAIIKNVTGDSFNEACLRELSRSKIPVNTIITGRFNPANNAIDFKSPNGDDCVAWVGATCEIVKTIPKDELKPGMVFFPDSNPDNHIVILKVCEDDVLMENVHTDKHRPPVFGMGFGWLEHTYYYVRTMSKEEFEVYN